MRASSQPQLQRTSSNQQGWQGQGGYVAPSSSQQQQSYSTAGAYAQAQPIFTASSPVSTQPPTQGGWQSSGGYDQGNAIEDEDELRRRQELERQRRIKERLDNSRGQPPPNFNLLSTPARPTKSNAEEGFAQQQEQQQQQQVAPTSDWRGALRIKKQQEEDARQQAERVCISEIEIDSDEEEEVGRSWLGKLQEYVIIGD